MANPTSVVFADVSSLSTSVGAISTCVGFQASRGYDRRPIYCFDSDGPALVIASAQRGSGAFTYIAYATMDGDTDFSGLTSVTVTGAGSPSGASAALTFADCKFAGKSSSLSANGETQVTVNFTFGTGSSF